MTSIEVTLRTLRDVEGVFGSFVIAGSGALVARDLPAVFDADIFMDVGPRITRLYETFFSGGEDMDACVLRYADHKLYVRKMTWGLMGVMSTVAVNMPALRMVANLVIRKIDPDVSLAPNRPSNPTPSQFPPPRPRERTSAPPLYTSAPDVVTPSMSPPIVGESNDASPPPSNRQVRMYRGRPVVDD